MSLNKFPAVKTANKPDTKVYIFRNNFEEMRHFDEYLSQPIKALEAQGYALLAEDKHLKTYTGGAGHEYAIIVETPTQDYLVFCNNLRTYATFLRNFSMIPPQLFHLFLPDSPALNP